MLAQYLQNFEEKDFEIFFCKEIAIKKQCGNHCRLPVRHPENFDNAKEKNPKAQFSSFFLQKNVSNFFIAIFSKIFETLESFSYANTKLKPFETSVPRKHKELKNL